MIVRKPNFLKIFKSVKPINILDALVYKEQFFQVGEVCHEVHPAYVIEAKVEGD